MTEHKADIPVGNLLGFKKYLKYLTDLRNLRIFTSYLLFLSERIKLKINDALPMPAYSASSVSARCTRVQGAVGRTDVEGGGRTAV